MVSHPPPPPYYAVAILRSYRGRVTNDLRYFRIFLPDTVSPGVKAHEITKVFFQEMLKEIFGKSFPRPRGSLTRPLPSPPASSSSSSSFRKVDPLKCVPPEPTGTLELQGFKPKTSCGTTVTRRTPTSIERWCARPQWEAGEGQVLTWARCGAVRCAGRDRGHRRERERERPSPDGSEAARPPVGRLEAPERL